MNELALFAGAGGGILGGALLGWNTVGAVEIEQYPREILLARQRDGMLPLFPVWDDVRTFDGKPWRGLVDVVSGGFPCQDISVAGAGKGLKGERSGLWREMYRIICEVRPKFAFVENSPMLTRRGIDTVLGDLAEAGFDAAWMVLGAADVGAPHKRDRMWILAQDRTASDADTDGLQRAEHRGQYSWPEEPAGRGPDRVEPRRDLAHASGDRRVEDKILAGLTNKEVYQAPEREPLRAGGVPSAFPNGGLPRGRRGLSLTQNAGDGGGSGREGNAWWLSEPDVGRVAHGVASKMDRLKAIGNGQVPLVAAVAFRSLYERLNPET